MSYSTSFPSVSESFSSVRRVRVLLSNSTRKMSAKEYGKCLDDEYPLIQEQLIKLDLTSAFFTFDIVLSVAEVLNKGRCQFLSTGGTRTMKS
jgi:hypothetical protein